MTALSWTTRIRHDSDAMFREWGSRLSSELANAGLVQTPDTGQINWASVTRPGSNAVAGYEIWRFDDTLQGTAPVFLKLSYGTGNHTSGPRLTLQVGTGSDGSGNLTGTLSGIFVNNSGAAHTSDTAYPSYLCVTEGFFGLNHKAGMPSINDASSVFTVERLHDSSGAPTGDGVFITSHSHAGGSTGPVAVQYLKFSGAPEAFPQRTSVNDSGLSVVPQRPITSTIGGGDTEAYLCWIKTPQVVPSACLLVVLANEVAQGGTFTSAPINGVSRTYIGCGVSTSGSSSAGPAVNTNWAYARLAMLWE